MRPVALVLTPRTPWPLDDGGRIVLHQAVTGAARAFDVVLVTFDVPGRPDEAPTDLRASCREIVRVPHRPTPAPAAALRGSLGPLPHTMVRFEDPAFSAAVLGAVSRHRPALAIVNNLHMAVYADDLGSTPWIYRSQNVEFRWMERWATARRNPVVRAYARFQAARLRDFERTSCERAAMVFAIQDEEAALLRTLAPRARVETVPIGIDLARYGAPAPADPPVVLVTGSFAYAPNVEGLRRFLEDGWPVLRKLAPRARLRVAGRGLDPGFREELGRAGVDAVGEVPEIAPEFAAASVLLVPVWIGAGARVKIVEAAAARVPVVSTVLGAEGLAFEPGREIEIADSPPDLARRVAHLLAEPGHARSLAIAARALVERIHSIDAVAERANVLSRSVLGESA